MNDTETETVLRPRPETAAQLRAAAATVVAAIKDLNHRQSNCGSCGLRHAENLVEHNAHSALEGIATKLRTWATTLEHPEDTPQAVRMRRARPQAPPTHPDAVEA